MGVHEYRFVRRYLERGPQLTLRQVDPLIRELVIAVGTAVAGCPPHRPGRALISASGSYLG
jgi:hypothetical protein